MFKLFRNLVQTFSLWTGWALLALFLVICVVFIVGGINRALTPLYQLSPLTTTLVLVMVLWRWCKLNWFETIAITALSLGFIPNANAGPVGPNTYVEFVDRVFVSQDTGELLICPRNISVDLSTWDVTPSCTDKRTNKNALVPLRLYTQPGYKLVWVDSTYDRVHGIHAVLYWEPTAEVLNNDKRKHQP